MESSRQEELSASGSWRPRFTRCLRFLLLLDGHSLAILTGSATVKRRQKPTMQREYGLTIHKRYHFLGRLLAVLKEMTGRESFAASHGVGDRVAVIVCGAAFETVELQQSSTNSGSPDVPTPTAAATATTGCQGCAPQVAVTAASLMYGDLLSTNAGTTFKCGAGSVLTLFSSVTASSSVIAATINCTGQTNDHSPAAGSSCLVDASGSASATQELLFVSAQLLTSVVRAYIRGYHHMFTGAGTSSSEHSSRSRR